MIVTPIYPAPSPINLKATPTNVTVTPIYPAPSPINLKATPTYKVFRRITVTLECVRVVVILAQTTILTDTWLERTLVYVYFTVDPFIAKSESER